MTNSDLNPTDLSQNKKRHLNSTIQPQIKRRCNLFKEGYFFDDPKTDMVVCSICKFNNIVTEYQNTTSTNTLRNHYNTYHKDKYSPQWIIDNMLKAIIQKNLAFSIVNNKYMRDILQAAGLNTPLEHHSISEHIEKIRIDVLTKIHKIILMLTIFA